MNGWFNPDNWMDVVDHLLLILGVVATAVIPSWFAARNHKEIRSVKDQVVNGHKSPMRDDLDRVLARLEELSNFLVEVGRGVSGLRSDLNNEEIRRRENIRELREDIDRKLAHIEARLNRNE